MHVQAAGSHNEGESSGQATKGSAALLSPTSLIPMDDSPIFSMPKAEVGVIKRNE